VKLKLIKKHLNCRKYVDDLDADDAADVDIATLA